MSTTTQFFYESKYYEVPLEITIEQFPDYALPENEIDAPADTDEYSAYRIYSYMLNGSNNHYKLPSDINYEIFWLFRKKTFVKWELTTEEFYGDYDWVTYSELVVKETITYTRDANGYVTHRDKDIIWYKENGTTSEVKTVRKYYNTMESIQEWYRRRSNILDDVKIKCIGTILATEYGNNPANFADAEADWKAFLTTLVTEIQLYKEWIKQNLLDAITDATGFDRLDNSLWELTIRQYLVSELTY